MRDQLIPACKLLLFNEMGHIAYCMGSFFFSGKGWFKCFKCLHALGQI